MAYQWVNLSEMIFARRLFFSLISRFWLEIHVPFYRDNVIINLESTTGTVCLRLCGRCQLSIAQGF